MDPADEFRKRAITAEFAAEATTDATLKKGFLDLAKQWRALADKAEAETKPKT